MPQSIFRIYGVLDVDRQGTVRLSWYVVGSLEEQGRKEIGGRETEREKDKEGGEERHWARDRRRGWLRRDDQHCVQMSPADLGGCGFVRGGRGGFFCVDTPAVLLLRWT
jgi:hypothetical protein